MNELQKKKILVIGSYGHTLGDKCVSWSESFPYLGDYDAIIINLQSLYEDLCNETMGKKLIEMRQEINEIIWASTEIICITAPTKNWGGFYAGELPPVYSNYHWCPIYLYFETKSGESFKEEKSGYFNFVKKWTHFLEKYYEEPYKIQKRKEFMPRVEPLLQNKANKPLAFELYFIEYYLAHQYATPTEVVRSNSIIFLPPPTEIPIKDAIDYLLKDIRGLKEVEKYMPPEWVNKIEVYNERSIQKEISKKIGLIQSSQKELDDLQRNLSSLIKYKQLLTEGGEGEAGNRLENIVEESLKLIGIEIKPGPKYKEDRIIIDPVTKEEIPLEIGGFIKSIPERKLTQLIGRLTDEKRPQKIKCRGVLIGNHYKDVSLDENLRGRKDPFEPDVIRKAESFDVCLLPTIELFKAVNSKLKGEDVLNFVNKIFNQKGLLNFE
jgi:hypothetical protein